MKLEKSVYRALNPSIIFIISFLFVFCTTLQIQAAVENLKSSGRTISFEIVIQKPDVFSTDGAGVRIILEGYGTFSPPGAVEIPGRIFNVAIPLEGDISLRAAVLEREDLGDIRLARKMGSRLVRGEDNTNLTENYLPDDPWVGKGLLPVVSTGREHFMGRVRVLPVRVSPVGKRKNGYWIARRILVTITAGSGGEPLNLIETLNTPVSPAWRSIYSRVLVNPNDAAVFARAIDRVKVQNLPQAGERRIKISIPETGLYVLRADSLIGTSGGGPFSTGQFALKRYYYDESEPDLTRKVDVPMRIIKGEQSSENYFEDDDFLIFHAVGIRDDPQSGDPDAAFTDNNIIWLIEGEAGVIMQDGPGRVTMAGPAEAYFTSEIKVRKDTYYQKKIQSGAEDFYFVAAPEDTEISVPFYCHYPYDSGVFKLTARIRGYATNGTKALTFKIRNSTGTNIIGTGSLPDNTQKTFVFDSNPSSWLEDGENQLLVEGDKQYSCMVNDFFVEYPAVYISSDNMLEFNLEGTGGTKLVSIQGFDSPAGYLVDITDETSPQFDTLQTGVFSGPDGNNKYTLSLELPADVNRRFIAFGEGAGRHIYNDWITLDSPSSLKNRQGPFHTLVISHRDFLPPQSTALSEYVDWREAQGYKILTADVQDVYDEFNGGLPSCEAIKRFIKYGFNSWGVEFVMLVGDASEDHKRLYIGDPPETRGSPPDFVPAYTFSMRMDAVGYADEVVATDKFYSFIDEGSALSGTGGKQDSLTVIDAVSGVESGIKIPAVAYPDVFVGRIPVGSDLEAKGVFFKLKNYKESKIDDSWRRNIILFADDAWSGSTSTYMY
ncbi:hypothetical protein J7M07_05870, partial [bacterium]|nr:hypothetical protein [bacterium]